MAAFKEGGPLWIELERDERFHRVYKIAHRVRVEDFGPSDSDIGVVEGPWVALNCPELPQPGDSYLMEDESDSWVYCLPNATVKRQADQTPDSPVQFYTVEQQFTSRAIERRIQQNREDPLLEHDVFSFSSTKFTEEAVNDRFGSRIQYSSHEAIRGPQNEWDMGRLTIKVEHISATLDLESIGSLMNTLNDAPIWGCPTRTLKLSDCVVSQLFWAFSTYYKQSFTFEQWIRQDSPLDPPSSGWDRDVLDESTKVLRGRWRNFGTATAPSWQWVLIGNPNPNNPGDFVRFQDVNGNLTRVVLDGAGRPYAPTGGATTAGCVVGGTSPMQWDVQSAWPAYYASLNGTLLDYLGSPGCSWQKTGIQSPANIINGGVITATLEYVVATTLWTLTVTGLRSAVGNALGDQKWTQTTANWHGNGTNTLTGDSGNSVYSPTTAIVSAAAANEPGSVHIEKYPSGSFLELGLATSFE